MVFLFDSYQNFFRSVYLFEKEARRQRATILLVYDFKLRRLQLLLGQ